jgi:hypothetical protein
MKLKTLMQKYYNTLFTYDRWNIGYLNQSVDSLIHFKKLIGNVRWLKEGYADYAADPFTAEIDNGMYLYYEELSFWKGKGQLMVADGFELKRKKKVVGITDPAVHLSYPYIFKHNGEVYCIPEISALNQVALYRVNPAEPWKFEKLGVILEGERFVDSSIIFYQDKFWLFTSVSGKPGTLYIFYSNELLGNFNAHPLNPIPIANETSRSAGKLFMVNQKLYMPCQNPAKCYGGSVIINELTRLNETEFEYTKAFELLPQYPYEKGLHTINFHNNLVIVDGKRQVFSLLASFKKLSKKMNE